VYMLRALTPEEIAVLLRRALRDREHGLGDLALEASDELLEQIAIYAGGDARAAYNILDLAAAASDGHELSRQAVEDAMQRKVLLYDKSGEEHYNLISALHKSLRNSDPQAAAYWLVRMLEGGEDPLYLARRLVRFASEDVGLADPQALPQALAARDAVHFLGLPEGRLALLQATVYLALAPKSNALYRAGALAEAEVKRGASPPVPMHLRNAPTRLMKDLGAGDGYVYAHDTREGIARMDCLPAGLGATVFYDPRGRGFEQELKDRMEKIRRWHQRRREAPADGGDE
ncbi:MAG: replication-associated recombination protein A, partial [Krumholzibacteria bacterium]|nr:replication-associated recombination protein A [Candidatus Krumholzibacteria bacterium]